MGDMAKGDMARGDKARAKQRGEKSVDQFPYKKISMSVNT
jgi:hypothetical protein